MIVGEIVAREGPVLTCRLVEHGHMRLDPVLIDQPAEHLGRAIGAIAHEPSGVETEAVHRALDHALSGEDFGLPDRRCRFDINNDSVFDIDQVVGGIGKERLPSMGSGPSRPSS
jgi:hypothetical protein